MAAVAQAVRMLAPVAAAVENQAAPTHVNAHFGKWEKD